MARGATTNASTWAFALAIRRSVAPGWKVATGMRIGMQDWQDGQTGA